MNRSLLLLTALSALLIYSCKDSESTNNNKPNNTNTMTANIGGVPWIATTATATKDSVMRITGMTSSDTIILIMTARSGSTPIPKATYKKAGKTWIGDGGANVSTLTANTVAGSFQVGVNDGAGNVITISSGAFNMTY